MRIKSYVEKTFLHSHNHKYPLHHDEKKVSSEGQQVNGYSFPDENNFWIIAPESDDKIEELQGTQVKTGDVIRLEHASTAGYLLTHDVASPLTMSNMEMTVWKKNNTEKNRHNETLWVLKKVSGPSNVETKRSVFQLRHVVQKVFLNNHKKTLPEWGFGQKEINGIRAGEGKETHWFFDTVKEIKGKQ